MFEKTEINEKETGVGPFKKIIAIGSWWYIKRHLTLKDTEKTKYR